MGLPALQDSERYAKDHSYLEKILKRRGVRGFDPETISGRIVHDMVDEIRNMVKDRNVPDVLFWDAAEMIVGARILARSIMTQLIILKAPRADKVHRMRYDSAIKALEKLNRQIVLGHKLLGLKADGVGPLPKSTESYDEQINSMRKELGLEAEDADYEEEERDEKEE